MEVFWGERELPQSLICLLAPKAAAATHLPTPPPPQPNWPPPPHPGRGSWPLSCPVRTAACDSEAPSSQPGHTPLFAFEDFQVLAVTGPPPALYSCLLWTKSSFDDVSSFRYRFHSNTATVCHDGVFFFLVTSFACKQATFMTANELKKWLTWQ